MLELFSSMNLEKNVPLLIIFFPEHQKIISEGFLKGHVTLKTGVMRLKNQLCHHSDIPFLSKT